MISGTCYASLAIYAERDRHAEITRLLGTPSRTGEKHGNFSYIYSTRDILEGVSIEEHLGYIQNLFSESTQELVQLFDEGCEMRLWIYFGVAQVNQSFVLQENFIKWLSLFGADVYVDAWAEI